MQPHPTRIQLADTPSSQHSTGPRSSTRHCVGHSAALCLLPMCMLSHATAALPVIGMHPLCHAHNRQQVPPQSCSTHIGCMMLPSAATVPVALVTGCTVNAASLPCLSSICTPLHEARMLMSIGHNKQERGPGHSQKHHKLQSSELPKPCFQRSIVAC